MAKTKKPNASKARSKRASKAAKAPWKSDLGKALRGGTRR